MVTKENIKRFKVNAATAMMLGCFYAYYFIQLFEQNKESKILEKLEALNPSTPFIVCCVIFMRLTKHFKKDDYTKALVHKIEYTFATLFTVLIGVGGCFVYRSIFVQFDTFEIKMAALCIVLAILGLMGTSYITKVFQLTDVAAEWLWLKIRTTPMPFLVWCKYLIIAESICESNLQLPSLLLVYTVMFLPIAFYTTSRIIRSGTLSLLTDLVCSASKGESNERS